MGEGNIRITKNHKLLGSQEEFSLKPTTYGRMLFIRANVNVEPQLSEVGTQKFPLVTNLEPARWFPLIGYKFCQLWNFDQNLLVLGPLPIHILAL